MGVGMWASPGLERSPLAEESLPEKSTGLDVEHARLQVRNFVREAQAFKRAFAVDSLAEIVTEGKGRKSLAAVSHACGELRRELVRMLNLTEDYSSFKEAARRGIPEFAELARLVRLAEPVFTYLQTMLECREQIRCREKLEPLYAKSFDSQIAYIRELVGALIKAGRDAAGDGGRSRAKA